MRKTFIDTLIELAKKDESIYLINGDLGFSFLEAFEKQFPKRYINCGVAEQNMMGIAAGLAMEGKKVYVYSIIPFAIFRCFEQLRNDIAYHNLDVKVVAAGAGFAYGTHGATHFAIEDIGVVRLLPNISILSPADPLEMKQLVLQSYASKSPAYIRLDKNSSALHQPKDKILMGKPSVIYDGNDGVIITTGTYLETMMAVCKKLESKNYRLKLISLHTIKPINEKALLKEIKGQKHIFVAEEHKVTGGIGTIIGEILLKQGITNITFSSFGAKTEHTTTIGKQDYMKALHGIDESSIYKKIINILSHE